uniref:E2 ubiquitin-conjugating enzyme n=1 Tax=Palpitomonas bilix TaxID=652834 RepID=A0A7S3GBV4_9EUKA
MRRIAKELRHFQYDPPEHITATPVSSGDYHNWTASITGPSGSPFEGGTFFLDVSFPVEYPDSPPKVKFSTKIYHPNVAPAGDIAVGLLRQESWSPNTSMVEILEAIRELLASPDPVDTLSPEIAANFRGNPVLYKQTAMSWTAKYAK